SVPVALCAEERKPAPRRRGPPRQTVTQRPIGWVSAPSASQRVDKVGAARGVALMTRGGLTQTGRRQTSSGPRGKARAARGIAARQFIGEAKFGFRHAARRALPLGRALGYWRLLHREFYLHLVERFVLRHQVFRSGRDPSDYVREAAD